MFSTLWAISADNILMICLFFPEKKMTFGDNLLEMSNPVCLYFSENSLTFGDNLHEMSLETVCMKCQILFPWKIRKY